MPKDPEVPDKIAFDYIKSNSYRVIHADGVWGGLTPRLNIFMGIWSERPPIPQHVVHSVNDQATLGPELTDERVKRNADCIREVEAGIVLDVALAKAVIKWLQSKIESLEEIKEKYPEATKDQGTNA